MTAPTVNPITRDRVRTAVATSLKAHGWRQATGTCRCERGVFLWELDEYRDHLAEAVAEAAIEAMTS